MHAHSHGAHGSSDGHEAARPPSKLLLAVLAPLVALTVVGAIALWPSGDRTTTLSIDFGSDLIDGSVEGVSTNDCVTTAPGSEIGCRVARVRLDEGPDQGDIFLLEIQDSPSSVVLEEGDRIVLNRVSGNDVPNDLRYSFADYQRATPLIVLALVFALAVVALGRWQGLRSLAALAVSLAVLLVFVLPSILDGNNAVAVALVGAALIMMAAIFGAQGYNDRTATAVIGTFASLVLTAALAALFIAVTRITGLADEDARILTLATETIDVRGILLGGIIIGALGVLDDVTVTQVSAVWELHRANVALTARELYTAALRIGRDHIASTVNTLVLAYAGASLPLLILLLQAERGIGDSLTSETIASEIVQTLVGSIGLVASVPITTALAAWAVGRQAPETAVDAPPTSWAEEPPPG